jgi:pyridinium-3,5-bisthiocarboxylic acid mononucleotide nickel chelatase
MAMTLAYFDCFSGISGDMTLGALVDAGVPIDVLRSELAKLNLAGYRLSSEQVTRSGLAATKVHVALEDKEQPARHLGDIRSVIDRSSLSPSVQQKSIAVFTRLAEAEAKVHGKQPDTVHFHEVGAVDAIVDIVGSVVGLEHLGVDAVIASPVNVGSGSVLTAHGRLPVPAPATAELLKGIPVYSSSIAFELTTPTGAAIISTVASSFGPLPAMRFDRVACGAGNKDLPGQPNVLRLFLGTSASAYDEDSAVLIETNIDDLNPQVYDHLTERLLQAGALDAYLTPLIMKKGRPGVLLSVLAERANVDALLDIVFRETTSIGVRIQEVGRRKLSRELREVRTPYGAVRVKVSRRGHEVLTITPEYEDCLRIARERGVPLKTVMQEAVRAAQEDSSSK